MTSPTYAERMSVARTAQASWAESPWPVRVRSLRRLRRLIAARSNQIVGVLSEETGKPALDALAGDVMVTLEQMRYYEKRAPRILRSRKIDKPAFLYAGARFYERYEPYGIVLIYAPANYPFQLAVIPLITALYAGNGAIVKSSERTPRVARVIAQLCRDAELPGGLVQVVDDAPATSANLLDAGPDLVFFTGSTEHGRAVARRASEQLIPCVLELGGKDAALVFADCNLERAVEGVVYGAFSNAGQVCVGIKRAYVEKPIYTTFCRKLTERVQELRIGESADADIGRMRGDVAKCTLVAQVKDAVERGATLLLPGDNLTGEAPIVLTDVKDDARLMVEETFGPVLCIAPFSDEREAVTLGNSNYFALSASVWTGNEARGRRIAAGVCAGTCAVNDVIRNIANPYSSFGGNRQSGYGRYHGPQGLLAFVRTKSVMITRSRRPREIHWFPSTVKTYERLRSLLEIRHSTGGRWSAIRRLFVLALLCVFGSQCLAAQEHDPPHLKITVDAPVSSHGQIAYLIFSSADGFPNAKDKAIGSGFQNLSDPATKVTIDAGPLRPGRYAVSVYQDVNGNKKLDSGFLGIPKEPVGVSNNPQPHMGPPSFDQCVFDMKETTVTISIRLVKP